MADKEMTWGEISAIAREAKRQYQAFEKIDQAAAAAVQLEDNLNKMQQEYLSLTDKITAAKAQLSAVDQSVTTADLAAQVEIEAIKDRLALDKQKAAEALAEVTKRKALLEREIVDARTANAAEIMALRSQVDAVRREAEADKRGIHRVLERAGSPG